MLLNPKTAAAEILRHRQERRTFEPFSVEFGIATFDQAYEVQAALVAGLTRGGVNSIVGYKIAIAPEAFGGLLLSGAVLSDKLIEDNASLSPSDFGHLGVEPEVCFRLGRDISPRDAPYSRADLRLAIDGVAAAFEIVDDRSADIAKFDLLSMIADNAWNAGVVAGGFFPLPASMKSHATYRTRASEDQHGEVNLDAKLELLGRFIDDAKTRGETLRRGQIVMTGSVFPIQFPTTPLTFDFELSGLGRVRVHCAG